MKSVFADGLAWRQRLWLWWLGLPQARGWAGLLPSPAVQPLSFPSAVTAGEEGVPSSPR